MPIELGWGNEEHSIIIQTFSGKWTWEEFHVYNGQHIPKMMGEVSHTVHVFSDFRNGKSLPFGSAINHAKSVIEKYPDNWGELVVVSDNLFIRTLVDIFCRLFRTSIGANVCTAETLEEAYALVNAQHETAKTP